MLSLLSFSVKLLTARTNKNGIISTIFLAEALASYSKVEERSCNYKSATGVLDLVVLERDDKVSDSANIYVETVEQIDSDVKRKGNFSKYIQILVLARIAVLLGE